MSEPKEFLARWSSRKLASRMPPTPGAADAEQRPRDEAHADNNAVAEKATAADAPVNQSFDPAQLPSLDSIGPDTDIAAFLRRDVPPELTRAALRRAWTSDPAIKNFVGLVENGWDFNDPSAMGGFGPISSEEVARLVGNVIAALPETTPAGDATAVSPSKKNSELASSMIPAAESVEAPKAEQAPRDSGNIAAQQNDTGEES